MKSSQSKGKGRGVAAEPDVTASTAEALHDIGSRAAGVAVFTDDPNQDEVGGKDPVDQLRRNADSLNQLTDAAAQMVAKLEEFLATKCSVGIDAQVPFRSWEDPNTCVEGADSLAYRRVGGAFRIAVHSWSSAYEDDESIKPWAECARDEKIDSIEALPDLIRKINGVLAERITKAKDSIYKVASMFTADPGQE